MQKLSICIYHLRSDNLKTYRRSFFGEESSDRLPWYLVFKTAIPLTSGALLFSRGRKTVVIVIRSFRVWTGACVSPPGKPSIAEESGEQDYLKVQFPPNAAKCVYQMPISISRDITHRGVNV